LVIDYTIPSVENASYLGNIGYSLSEAVFNPPVVFATLDAANSSITSSYSSQFSLDLPLGTYILDSINNAYLTASHDWYVADQACSVGSVDVATTGETTIAADMHVRTGAVCQ
jgi:hypothetical protein